MRPAWLALLAFALVAATTVLWFARARQVRIPADRRGFVAAWLLGVALGVAALLRGAGWVAGPLAGVAVVVGSFLSFTVAISRQKVGPDAIRVGEKLREFTATDEEGRPFSLSSLAGRPVVLKFFRGHW